MRIVLGVLAQDAGEVRWAGRPIDAAARARFGYMPEERGLYPKMQVREQLAYFAELHGAERAAAGEAADRWLDRSASRSAPATVSRRCRSATSSACSSRPRSCTTRSRSCSTSRSAASTRWAWT